MAKIRRYESSDRDELVQLWQLTFPDEPAHNSAAKVIDQKLLVDDLIFVAEQGEGDSSRRLVGACMAGYDGHRGWLYSVGVLPDQRRCGIGEKLVAHSIESLRSLGCTKINLQIRANNTAVASFYVSLGFAVEDRMSMGLHV